MSALRDWAEAVAAREAADRASHPKPVPSLEPWMAGPLAALADPAVTALVMAGYGLRGIIEGEIR